MKIRLLLQWAFCLTHTILSGQGQPNSPIRIALEDALKGGYELIYVADGNQLLAMHKRGSLPDSVWVKWPTNVTALPSLASEELVEIWPRNETEFVSIIEQVSLMLENIKEPWRVWRPLMFIHWSVPSITDTSENTTLSNQISRSLSGVQGRFPVDCDIFIFTMSNDFIPDLQVFEIYSLGKKTYLEKLDLKGLKLETFSSFLNKAVRRQNLRKTVIRAMAYEDPNYLSQVTLERRSNGKLVLGRGLCPLILRTMQSILNFSIEAVVGDGILYQEANGSWTGMAEQMRNGEADMTINLSTLLAYRLKVVDFLHPLTRVNVQAFFNEPQASSIRNILTSPLSSLTWVSILAMWTLVVTSLTLIHFIRLRWVKEESESDAEIVDGSLLWVLATLCQQGWYLTPSSRSLKVIFFCTTVFGYVTFVAFSAALVPILSVETVLIGNKEELGRSGFRFLGDINLPHVEKNVRELESYRQESVKPKVASQMLKIEDAMPQVMAGDVAFVGFLDGFMTVFQRMGGSTLDYCENYHSIPLADSSSQGFTIRKGSEYKEIFNHKILLLTERGLLGRNLRRYKTQTSAQCAAKARSRRGETLEIPDVATAYFTLILGTLLSLFNIALELLFEKFRTREQQRNKASFGTFMN